MGRRLAEDLVYVLIRYKIVPIHRRQQYIKRIQKALLFFFAAVVILVGYVLWIFM